MSTEKSVMVNPALARLERGYMRWKYFIVEIGGSTFYAAANPNKNNGCHAILKGDNELRYYTSRQNLMDGLPARTRTLEKAIHTLGGLVDEMEDEEFILTMPVN